MIKPHGLKFDKFETDHYILGGGFIGTKEILPDGQWDGFLPGDEIQNKNGVETMNCSGYGTAHCISILINFIFHETDNFSERFIGIMAGTDPNSGNSPHKVAESIRSNGLIPDGEMPFGDDITDVKDYYSPIPMPVKYLLEGQKWLRAYEFKHEWVFTSDQPLDEKIRLIKEALKRSPVGMSVYAWGPQDEFKTYHKFGASNHWVCCYGWTDRGWKIFDSYDNTRKVYAFDDIEMAKLYWISLAPPVVDNWAIALLKSMLKFMKDIIFNVYARLF